MTCGHSYSSTSVLEIYCIHYFWSLGKCSHSSFLLFYLKSCFVRSPVLWHLSPSPWEGCKLHLLCIPCCLWSGGEIGFHVGSLVLAAVCCSFCRSGLLHPTWCNWLFNSVFLRQMTVCRRKTVRSVCWLFTFSSFLCPQQVLLHRLNQYAVSKIDKNITEETVKVSFGHTIGFRCAFMLKKWIFVKGIVHYIHLNTLMLFQLTFFFLFSSKKLKRRCIFHTMKANELQQMTKRTIKHHKYGP